MIRVEPSHLRPGTRLDPSRLPGTRARNSPIGLPARTGGQGKRHARLHGALSQFNQKHGGS